MHFSPQLFQEDYVALNKQIHVLHKAGKIEEALDKIDKAGRAAYKYKFDEMADPDLESLLDTTAREFLEDISYTPEAGKIVFLDSFCWDNKGLSEQYLDALIALNYSILLIVTNDTFYGKGNRIISTLKTYAKGEVKIYKKTTHLGVASCILEDVRKYAPDKVFLHPSPWDVVAFLVMRKLKDRAQRYFINITDNHFWLGLNTFDIILEFRSYGRQFSELFRSVEAEKIRVLPFFPIVRNMDEFRGLPIERSKDAVIAISGGNGYKFLGGGGVYVRLTSALLQNHPNLILIIVGAGKEGELTKKRFPEALHSRIILEPSRRDIYQLIRHCDLYITSAPRVGGMINQMAIMAEVPILSYTHNGIKGFQIHPVSPLADISHCDFDSEESFLSTATKLITEPRFKEEYVRNYSRAIISKDEFAESLEKIINGERPYQGLSMASDLTAAELPKYAEIIVEAENHFNSEYHLYMSSSKTASTPIPDTPLTIFQRVKRKLKFKVNQWLGNSTQTDQSASTAMDSTSKLFADEPFKSIGEHTRGLPDRYIVINPQYIEIGARFGAMYNLRLEAWDNYASQRFLPELKIGNNVSMNTDVHIGCINKVHIGDNVLMASKIYISDHSHGDVSDIDLAIPPAQRELYSKGPVVIENNVWIGEGVAIMPNVTIGENSIVGANAVVTKSFPRNSIIAGNPAVLLRTIPD